MIVENRSVQTLKEFAFVIHKTLRSDRDCMIGIGGFKGEGKSTFSTKLQKLYSEIAGIPWSFRHMTWHRDELQTWVDGKGKDKEGQMPEYSAVLPDELISMFYRRNWFDDDQKGSVELFNKCRDRHLLIIGNVPSFWDLDPGFTKNLRFYIYIPERGRAWVFEQENNPFVKDPWNATENLKLFRKFKNPYKCANFVCEIHFDDWEEKEKEEYYRIRNYKRINSESNAKKKERYAKIKCQRDNAVKMLLNMNEKVPKEDKFKRQDIASMIGIDKSMIGKIEQGLV